MHKPIQKLIIIMASLLVLLTSLSSMARIPEPDVIYYGEAVMNGTAFTAQDTQVQIRAEVNGTTLVSYAMGDKENVGDHYVLYIPMDSIEPSNPDSAQEGDTALIFLSTGGQDYHVATLSIGVRGSVTEILIDATDTDNDGLSNSLDKDDDNDGMPDLFEKQYGYNSLNSTDAESDWDHDGINALTEFQNGTNPNYFDSDGDGIDDDKDADSSQFDFPVVLRTGLNLFALPIVPESGLTSEDILIELGGLANSISRLDANGVVFEKTTIVDNTISGTVFLIAEGQGYLIDMENNYEQLWSGPLSLIVPNLVSGLNVVTFPSIPEGFSAHLLIDQIDIPGAISSIQRFNRETGRFETAVYDQNTPSGFNFPIQRGETYIISTQQGISELTLPQAPVVTITAPVLGLDVTSATVDVIGNVDDVDALVQVNGVDANIINGEFIATDVPLNIGVNTLTVTAEDSQGLIGRTQQRLRRDP